MGGGHLAGLLSSPWRGGPAGWLGVDSPLRRGGPVGPGSASVGLSSPLVRGGSAWRAGSGSASVGPSLEIYLFMQDEGVRLYM